MGVESQNHVIKFLVAYLYFITCLYISTEEQTPAASKFEQIQHLSERLKWLEVKGMPFIRLNTVSVP